MAPAQLPLSVGSMGCGSSTDKGAAGGLSTSGASRGGGEAAAAAAALCGGAVEFTSEVEVSISCKGLPNKDLTRCAVASC